MKKSSTIARRIIQGLALVLGLLGASWLFCGVVFRALPLMALSYITWGSLMVCIAYSVISRRRIPGIPGAILLALVLALAFLIAADAINVHRQNRKVSEIKQGDTIGLVLSIMGEPEAVYPKGSKSLSLPFVIGSGEKSNFKKLVYGASFKWDSAFMKDWPFFIPVNIRLFGPEWDDIVVYFNEDDQVVRIEIPEKE